MFKGKFIIQKSFKKGLKMKNHYILLLIFRIHKLDIDRLKKFK